MDVQSLRNFLLCCAALNYGLLLVWGLLLLTPHAWLHRLWGRWLRLPAEQFDALNFGGLLLYKVGIFLFNLVPLVALWLVRWAPPQPRALHLLARLRTARLMVNTPDLRLGSGTG